MAVTRDLKAREISFRLEGFSGERKRDLKTTLKIGNPGQLIKLVNFFVAAGILMQAGDIHVFNKSGRHLELQIYDVIRGKASAAIFKF